MQRNIDNQIERMIHHLHQAIQVIGELHLLLYPGKLRHQYTPISRKYINGRPPKNQVRCQSWQLHKVPCLYHHPKQPTPVGMWDLGASHIHSQKLEVFLHSSIQLILGINMTGVKELRI